jgi:RNA polymerase sigma-70 factor (ECF subfamily)
MLDDIFPPDTDNDCAQQREFEVLYRKNRQRAYNLAYRLLGNRAEAEDVTQDAFVRAWHSFAQYDRLRPFESWLMRIVTNLVIDRRRRQKRVNICSLDAPAASSTDGSSMLLELPDSSREPESLMMAGTYEESLQNALSLLPLRYREPVLLADVEERSYEEIAALLNCPVGTVRSRIHRARLMLRNTLMGNTSRRRRKGGAMSQSAASPARA